MAQPHLISSSKTGECSFQGVKNSKEQLMNSAVTFRLLRLQLSIQKMVPADHQSDGSIQMERQNGRFGYVKRFPFPKVLYSNYHLHAHRISYVQLLSCAKTLAAGATRSVSFTTSMNNGMAPNLASVFNSPIIDLYQEHDRSSHQSIL